MRSSTTPTLTECLETDHRRLDGVVVECKRLATSGEYAAAAEQFASFARGLSRHIDAEEEVLFPALQEHAPQAGGPLHVMRREHEKLREMLGTVEEALRASRPIWRSGVGALEDLLAQHNLKEERILYPMANEATSEFAGLDALRASLVAALDGSEA